MYKAMCGLGVCPRWRLAHTDPQDFMAHRYGHTWILTRYAREVFDDGSMIWVGLGKGEHSQRCLLVSELRPSTD